MACVQSETGWHIGDDEIDRPDVVALLAHHLAEMRADSPPEACHVLPLEGLKQPKVRLFALRDGADILLGVGALKVIAPGHGEVKSMRTHPDALGCGAGRAMLAHIVAAARGAGLTRLTLETGNSDLFVPANRLYESAGFVRCGPFGGYRDTPFTHFYTLQI
ncbi:MAG: GNAT family N-acetyltransferase [Sphingomicrobium sp.]